MLFMKTEWVLKKIRLEIVANDYDLPGGIKRLARHTGLTPCCISKALHGHYQPAYQREILDKLYAYFKNGVK
jgi:hypothetical protein